MEGARFSGAFLIGIFNMKKTLVKIVLCFFIFASFASAANYDGNSQNQRIPQKSLVGEKPEWLGEIGAYRLPLWYEQHRVHGYTGLSLKYLKKDIFFKAAEAFKAMGAPVYVRYVKHGDEGAWWPSRIGAILPEARHRNLAKQIIDNAHKLGLKIIVYYRHMEDKYMGNQHPAWICRDWENRPIRKDGRNRGIKLCFNSPYADFVQERLIELVDMGADGFYFDSSHMPRTGCWCDYCKKKFREETGLNHPVKPDPADPLWHKLIDFNNRTIERTFLKWRQAIHKRNPEVVMLVSSDTWPSLADRHTTNRLYRIADSVKTEFSLPWRKLQKSSLFSLPPNMEPLEKDAKIALGYTMIRDAADGRPGHVWTHGLLNITSALYATAGIVAHGSIANLDVPARTLPAPMFEEAFDLGNKVSKYLAGTVPVRWTALHYPEYARDHYATNPRKAWEKVLYPFYGAYLALLRRHLPVGIVTDSQLEEGLLKGYKVLFLPAPDMLTERMQQVVREFMSQGGLVVEQRESWQWYDPNGGQRKAIQLFLEEIAEASKKAPVQVYGGPEKLHSVPFVARTGNRLTVCLANDFSWVYTGNTPTQADFNRKPPPPCTGVSIMLRGYGALNKVFDAVSGVALSAKNSENGIEISVPTFEYMAVIVVEFSSSK